jgi:cell division protein FtsB
MTSTSRRHPTEQSGADPWWGFDEPVLPDAPVASAPTSGRSRRASGARTGGVARRRRRSGLSRVGWILIGVLLAPIDLLRRLLARSPRLRRLAIRAAVVLAVLTVLACSVGVILINNVVIGRTAELGELDDRRRELRRENAVLGAKAARLSSPDVVFRRATKELGMVRTDDVPQFIYLVPGSRTLTPWQRQRVAERAQQRRDAAKGDAAKDKTATTDEATTDAAKATTKTGAGE